MSACPNCGNKLTCGCQKRKASNGVFVCRSCINTYEKTLQTKTVQQQPTTNSTSSLKNFIK